MFLALEAEKMGEEKFGQRHVCFVNVQSSLPENVVFSVCAHVGNAAYIIFIMWNSISGLDAWYHLRLNIIFEVMLSWHLAGDIVVSWH